MGDIQGVNHVLQFVRVPSSCSKHHIADDISSGVDHECVRGRLGHLRPDKTGEGAIRASLAQGQRGTYGTELFLLHTGLQMDGNLWTSGELIVRGG